MPVDTDEQFMDQRREGQMRRISAANETALCFNAARAQGLFTRINCARINPLQFTGILPRYPRIGAAPHTAVPKQVCQIRDGEGLDFLVGRFCRASEVINMTVSEG